MVTVTVECPDSSFTVMISAPRSRRREAKVCRSVCHVTPSISAFSQTSCRPASSTHKRAVHNSHYGKRRTLQITCGAIFLLVFSSNLKNVILANRLRECQWKET